MKINKDSLSIQSKFLFEEVPNAKIDDAYLLLAIEKETWKKLPVNYKDFKRKILLK